MSTTAHPARITVDLSEDDYQTLEVAAAMAGSGTTISSNVRQLVRDWLEERKDEADLALIRSRTTTSPSTTSHDEVMRRLHPASVSNLRSP
ncbi:MAG: hypothetical protein LBV06_00540 [Propionibacteriaceae bacterium]|jgi:Arc/MetJ-type ribon-helix-helix transcriptional regulator|nr:hypothetical protein [Propionibacteriaceae bacterium]